MARLKAQAELQLHQIEVQLRTPEAQDPSKRAVLKVAYRLVKVGAKDGGRKGLLLH